MEIQPIVSENWHDWNSDNGFSIDLLSYHIRLGFLRPRPTMLAEIAAVT